MIGGVAGEYPRPGLPGSGALAGPVMPARLACLRARYVRERQQSGRVGRVLVFLALRRVQLRNRVPAVAYSASRGTGVKAGSPVAACIASRTLTTLDQALLARSARLGGAGSGRWRPMIARSVPVMVAGA